MEGEGENGINFCIIEKWYKLNLIVLFFFRFFVFCFFFGFLFIISSQRARLFQWWLKHAVTTTAFDRRRIDEKITQQARYIQSRKYNLTYEQKKRTIRYQFYKKSHKKRENKTKPNTKSTKKDYPGAYTSHLSYFFARKMWCWKSTKAITIYTLMWRRTKSDERCPIFSIKTGTWTSTFELVSSFLLNVANQIK